MPCVMAFFLYKSAFLYKIFTGLPFVFALYLLYQRYICRVNKEQ
jgi:hypothetical protein